MQRRREPDGGAEHVRDHSHVVRARHGGDLPKLGEAAADANIGLDDVERALLDHAAESPAATKLLGARDAYAERAANLDIALDVVSAHGLFEPQEIVLRHLAADGDRAADVV